MEGKNNFNKNDKKNYNENNKQNNYQGGKPKKNNYRPKPKNNVDKFSEMNIGGPPVSDFMKALECPVCLDPMLDTILMCETGHSLCNACSVKLTPPLCPMCRSKITLQRNFSLEQMAKSMILPCSNAEFGCKFANLPGQLQKHLEICDFREVLCPLGRIFNSCKWEGPNAHLTAHVKEDHPGNFKFALGKENTLNNFSSTETYSNMQMMTLGADSFLLHIHVNVYDKVCYFAVQYVGPQPRANRWKYTVHLYNKSEPMKKIEQSDMCTSDSVNASDVFSRGDCVGVPLHVLNRYIQKDRNLNFKVFANPQKNEE